MTKDEALKMAIELLSKEDDYELQAFYDEGVKVKEACKQALEQKEQEPVGITDCLYGTSGGFSYCVFNSINVLIGTELYTSPQLKPYVPLTDIVPNVDELVKALEGVKSSIGSRRSMQGLAQQALNKYRGIL